MAARPPALYARSTEGPQVRTILALRSRQERFVGGSGAIVVGRQRYIAEDACELIEVEYEPLDAIATFEQALVRARPKIFER